MPKANNKKGKVKKSSTKSTKKTSDKSVKSTKSGKNSKSTMNTSSDTKRIHVHNKETSKAQLLFNINISRERLKAFYENQEMELPKFRGGHVVLASIMQEFLRYVLTQVKSLVPSNSKDGLRTVNEATMRSIFMKERNNLVPLWDRYHPKFVRGQDYLSQTISSVKDFNKFVDLTLGKNWKVTPLARTYVCYFMTSIFNDIANISRRYLTASGKKQLDTTTVRYSAWVVFRNAEELASLVDKEAVRSADACGFFKNDAEDAEDGEDAEDAKNEEDAEDVEDAEDSDNEEDVGDSDNEEEVEDSDNEEEEIESDNQSSDEEPVKKPKRTRQTKSRS